MFEVLHEDGLERLWDTYGFAVAQEHWPPRLDSDRTDTTEYFTAWSYLVEHHLAAMMTDGELPRRWLDDWLAPHNLRAGMLLGYPAKAIESYLNDPQEQFHATRQRHRSARIRHAGMYHAAEPVYDYHRDLATDPQIVAHQQLWSAILKGVYGSAWHKRLRNDTIFQAALAKVAQAEERDDNPDNQ